MAQLLFKINQDKILRKLEEIKFTPAELKEIRKQIPNCNDFYWWDFQNNQGFIRDKQGKMWTWKGGNDGGEPDEEQIVLKRFCPELKKGVHCSCKDKCYSWKVHINTMRAIGEL